MSNKKIWFITGASRGMGVDFAKAALAAGHAVVASLLLTLLLTLTLAFDFDSSFCL